MIECYIGENHYLKITMSVILYSRTVAILSRVNELGTRYGFGPSDFIATFKSAEPPQPSAALEFEIIPSETPEREKRFDQMLAALGVTPTAEEGAILRGESDTILNALDKAIKNAPRPPRRV